MEPRYCVRCQGETFTSDPKHPAHKCPGCGYPYISPNGPDPDKAAGLLSLALKMREAQKQYFKTRSGDWLAQSKALEREFDKAADLYFNPPKPDLFNVDA